MSFLLDLFLWFLLWLISFGVFFLLRRKGVTYIRWYGLTAFLFLLFTILAVVIFNYPFQELVNQLTSLSLLILVFFYGLTIFAYRRSHQKLQKPELLIKNYPDQYFIKGNYRYLFSKSFDILFQQTMVVIAIFFLSNAGFSLQFIIIYFILLF